MYVSGSENFANDILEHRCTGQDDHKPNKGRGLVITSNHALEKLPILPMTS